MQIPAPHAAAAPFDRDEHQARLIEQLGNDWPKPTGWNVLIAIFTRPDKTKGGIILTDKTKAEDEYQGRVGLVLELGPDAYQGDRTRQFPAGPWVQPGDWVIFPAFENSATRHRFRGVSVAQVPDDRFTAIVSDPMEIG